MPLTERSTISAPTPPAPIVPLVYQQAISLTGERVGNYQHHPFWGPLLDQLWVE